MHINKLTIDKCFNHDHTELSFPETGLCLITGNNGSGKSSIANGIASGLWGKSFGAPPWRKDGSTGTLVVETDTYKVKREKSVKSSAKLSFGPIEGELKEHGTASKAQKELNELIQDWDTWKRVSSLRADMLGTFAKASDAERKRLIEQLTDSDRFDPALKKARDEKKELKKKITTLEKDEAILEERIKNVNIRIKELHEDIENVDIPERINTTKFEKKRNKCREHILATQDELKALEDSLLAAQQSEREAKFELKAAQKEATRLDIENCPTCGQGIPSDMREALRCEVEKAEKELATKQKETKAVTEDIESEIEELEDVIDDLGRKERQIDKKLIEAKHVDQKIADLEKEKEKRSRTLEAANKNKKKSAKELTETQNKLKTYIKDLAVVKAAEAVLGVTGVRSHIIGAALKGIQSLTNAWLLRIGWHGLSVELRPYSEKANSDGLSDKISLKVNGCGGGYGYEAASRGEQRRIDLAFLFAFGEFAAAAKAMKPGTLWMDEVLDGLDDEGIEAVSGAIMEIAQKRAVIIISHRENLASYMRPDIHWHVEDGRVIDVGKSTKKEF